MKKKKKTIRNLVVGFIAFMASILLVGLSLLFILQYTLFSANHLIKAADKADYYENIAKQATTQIQDYGLGSGIPQEVLKEVIKPNQVEKDFSAYATQAYHGGDYLIEKEAFFVQLKGPIMAYADKQSQPPSEESLAAIDRFTERSFEAYSQFIKLPYLVNFGQIISRYSSQLMVFKVILGSGLVLMAILIVYLLHWWWHRLFRNLAFIFSGSGLMLIVLPVIILQSGVVKRISIGSQYLYELLTIYFETTLQTFIAVGGAYLLFSIVFGIISTLMRKKATSI